jgi:hypothetical protein
VRTEARFPAVERDGGHYESFYIKAARPEGGLGVWIRHTVHKRPGAEPLGSIWFVLFDAEAAGPVATKATFPAADLAAGDGAYIRVDGATLEPGRAVGELRTEVLDASWELDFSDPGPAFRHLPYGWMYRAPLPRTKLLSPYPGARFAGRLTVAGRELELDGWPGMIGHNWGAEHAERWVWIQGAGFGGDDTSYLDIAAGQVKIGPWTTPWIANGVLRLGGESHRLGGLDRVRSTEIDDEPTSCGFRLTGKGVTVRGRVSAERRNFVGWIYADPIGPEHNTLNCSISDLQLTIERADRGPQRFQLAGGAAYEIGMRESDHGIPIQPYSDGEPPPHRESASAS